MSAPGVKETCAEAPSTRSEPFVVTDEIVGAEGGAAKAKVRVTDDAVQVPLSTTEEVTVQVPAPTATTLPVPELYEQTPEGPAVTDGVLPLSVVTVKGKSPALSKLSEISGTVNASMLRT